MLLTVADDAQEQPQAQGRAPQLLGKLPQVSGADTGVGISLLGDCTA